MTRRDTARRTAPLTAALAVALAGCGSATPSPMVTPAPTGPGPTTTETLLPSAEVFAEIRDAVVAIRGLEPTSAVDPLTIDEAQMRINLLAEFDATQTPAQLKVAEDLLGALGLLPKGASLRALTADLQGDQVAGYYSPEKDELFIVNRSGTLGPVDEATYAHEFTHQLQDQAIDLDALGLDVADQSDRSFARLALVEGDATSVQSTWMIRNLDSKELGELLAAALDPEALASLQRAPAYLRDTAVFGYQDGLAFVTRLLANGGYAAVDAAFADPPDSTEQILHPDKYLVREAPIPVKLPRAAADVIAPGWSEAGQDTLGELLLRIWLNEGGVANAAARTATAGWGGDRVALYRGPDGASSVVLHSEWDTVTDADEFAAAATSALARISPTGQVAHEPGSKTVLFALGDPARKLISVVGG